MISLSETISINPPDSSRAEGFGAKVLGVIEKYGGESVLPQWLKQEDQIPYLQPLVDIHLHSNFKNEIKSCGDPKQIYMLAAIAFFILAIAFINFAYLASSRANSLSRYVCSESRLFF